MKIILRNFPEPRLIAAENFPKLVETPAGHSIGEKEINWKEDFQPLTYRYYVWADQESKMVSLDSRYVVESREGVQVMASLYGHRYLPAGDRDFGLGCGPTAVVFFADTIEDSVLLVNQFCVTDLPHTLVSSNERRLKIIADHCPAAKPYFTRWMAKRELLAYINTNDAIANLEKQVDLLSELVFALADATSEKPEWYADFKRVTQEAASASPSLDSVQKMGNEKAQLRSLVAKYIQQRG